MNTAIDEMLEDFLKTDRAIFFGCTMVSFLAGVDYEGKGDTEEAIRVAKQNLKKFSVVGRLENLDEFAAALSNRHRVSFNFEHYNQNPIAYKTHGRIPSTRIVKQIDNICAPDLELYNHAKRIFSWK